MTDPLFACRNLFFLGAYQSAISEASNLTGLSEAEKIERDVFVYRSYIELGTYEVRDGAPPPCKASPPELAQPTVPTSAVSPPTASGPCCSCTTCSWLCQRSRRHPLWHCKL